MTNTFSRSARALAQICSLLVAGCGVTALAETLNLPPGVFTPTVTFSTNESLPAFATVQFTTLPSGYNVSSGTYNAWCVDINQNLIVSPTSNPNLYSEDDAGYELFNTYPTSGIPTITGVNNANFPLVNWLLNHKTGATGEVSPTIVDIQEAIWKLLNGSYEADPPFTNSFNPSSPSAAAQQLVADAEANGAGFAPAPGQIVAILLDGISQPGNSGPPQSLIIEVTVPRVCPGANSSLINNLNSAGPSNFAVLSLGGSGAVVNLNLATVVGNIGVPNFGTFQESKPSSVSSEIIVGSSVNTSGATGSHGAIVVNDTLLSQAVQAANAAASYFAGLAPTPSVQAQFPSNGTISTNVTVTGTVGLNVIDVSSFTLNGGTLTLTGPAGTAFVINDSGSFNLHLGTIQVSGGVGPLDVVYNITNSSATVTTMVPTTAVGILLAPNNSITSMDSQSFTGEVIGGYEKTIVLMSGTKVTNPCQ